MICIMFNIRSVDLNLLPVFVAAYEERSLSRASVRLAMTQSAVSHAVNRLRALFRDELFVRQSRGVLPTPGADRVYAKLRAALASVTEAVTDARGFDPGTSERRFFVTIPHPLGPMIALRLQERLARSAPKVEAVVSTRSRPDDLDRALREERVDALIDWITPKGGEIEAAPLFEDGVIAVARKGHPALRNPGSAKVFRAGRFVSLRARVGEDEAPAGVREVHRLRLNIALEVSEILEVFMVANQSNLFGVIPRSMESVARTTFGLRPLLGFPKTPALPIKLFWHASRTTDPAHAFLRNELGAVSRQVAGLPAT